MISVVWGIITLPFAIVGFAFKLAILTLIIGISIGVYFVGEYLGWDNIVTFARRIVND